MQDGYEFVRQCSTCGNEMSSGYCIGDGEEYYCSDDCLHAAYTQEEYMEMFENDQAYWTEWEDSYKEEILNEIRKLNNEMNELEKPLTDSEKLQLVYDTDDCKYERGNGMDNTRKEKIVMSSKKIMEKLRIGFIPTRRTEKIERVWEGCEDIKEFIYIQAYDTEYGYGMGKPDEETLTYLLGKTIDELWEIARKNTEAETVIETMPEKLMKTVPPEYFDELMGQIENAPEIPYVISNTSSFYGASSILAMDKVKKYIKDKGFDSFYILPSSVHEVLAIPCEEIGYDDVLRMVREVNETEVEEKDFLADAVITVRI